MNPGRRVVAEPGRKRWASLLSGRSWRGAATNASRLLLMHARLIALEAFWRARALVLGARVPPGRLRPFDFALKSDQRFVLDTAGKLGPVFKARERRPLVDLRGRARSRPAPAHRARGGTSGRNHRSQPALSAEVPCGGWMGKPTGAIARSCSRRCSRLRSRSMPPRSVPRRRKDSMPSRASPPRALHPESQIRPVLRTAVGRIMLRLLFGLDPASPRFEPRRARLSELRSLRPGVPCRAGAPGGIRRACRRSFARSPMRSAGTWSVLRPRCSARWSQTTPWTRPRSAT